MMNWHWLQHVPFEGPGIIEEYALKKGCTMSSTRLYLDESLPDPSEIDFLLVMGGPMSVNDHQEYTWLHREKQFIGACIESGLPVLGICLGAQLIANVLGADVYPGPEKEIGWFPVTLANDTEHAPFTRSWPVNPTVFHWHGDTFDLPDGACRLASSVLTKNQAFSWGDTVIGLQFHLEMTETDIKRIIQHCGHEIIESPGIQTPKEMAEHFHHLQKTHAMMKSLLDSLLYSV